MTAAEKLKDGIQRVIDRADPADMNHARMRFARVPLRTLRQWQYLAESLDSSGEKVGVQG